MTNASQTIGDPRAGPDTAPLRAKWGWIVALGVVYTVAGFIALGSVASEREDTAVDVPTGAASARARSESLLVVRVTPIDTAPAARGN